MAIPSCPLRCHYFNKADEARVADFDIALGDWAIARRTTTPLAGLIQPVAVRAPEGPDRRSWNKKTDWLGLGRFYPGRNGETRAKLELSLYAIMKVELD
ncbi:hypothetical protein VTK26DRAFT_6300 [Humicola hyalothermophila]